MSRKTPKFEALVVNAIRRLQAAQGSTASEIANYLNQEYDVSGPEIRRQIQLTIRRGLNYGILQKSKRGYTTCDRNIPEVDPVDEDCYDCRARRRRGGDKILSRRARSKKRRSGLRGFGKMGRSGTMTGGRTKRNARKHGKRAVGCTRRSQGMKKKARSGRRVATKPTTRRPTNMEKAKQKKQNTSKDPPQTNSNTSTNKGRSSSKSPIRNESERNQE